MIILETNADIDLFFERFPYCTEKVYMFYRSQLIPGTDLCSYYDMSYKKAAKKRRKRVNSIKNGVASISSSSKTRRKEPAQKTGGKKNGKNSGTIATKDKASTETKIKKTDVDASNAAQQKEYEIITCKSSSFTLHKHALLYKHEKACYSLRREEITYESLPDCIFKSIGKEHKIVINHKHKSFQFVPHQNISGFMNDVNFAYSHYLDEKRREAFQKKVLSLRTEIVNNLNGFLSSRGIKNICFRIAVNKITVYDYRLEISYSDLDFQPDNILQNEYWDSIKSVFLNTARQHFQLQDTIVIETPFSAYYFKEWIRQHPEYLDTLYLVHNRRYNRTYISDSLETPIYNSYLDDLIYRIKLYYENGIKYEFDRSIIDKYNAIFDKLEGQQSFISNGVRAESICVKKMDIGYIPYHRHLTRVRHMIENKNVTCFYSFRENLSHDSDIYYDKSSETMTTYLVAYDSTILMIPSKNELSVYNFGVEEGCVDLALCAIMRYYSSFITNKRQWNCLEGYYRFFGIKYMFKF